MDCFLQADPTYQEYAEMDNLIIFQSESLVIKSFSCVHTLAQKLGREDKDDIADIKAILEHMHSNKKVELESIDEVLKFLSEALPNYMGVMEKKNKLFRRKLSKIYKS